MDVSNNELPIPSRPEMPPYIILLLLVLAALIGALLGSGLAYGWLSMQGFSVGALMDLNADSPRSLRDAVRMANLLNHVSTFTIPSLALILIIYRDRWIHYFKLEKFPSATWLVVGIIFVVASFPFAQLSYWINQQLPLPAWMLALENSTGQMIKGLLVMESPVELLFNILVIAVLPAFGEELLFRGVLQQQLQRAIRNPVVAIWLTALIFSAIHMQFAGFIPRVLLGAVLGYVFYWSKSLWLPIVAHFVTNAVQVIAVYVSKEAITEMDLEAPQEPNWLPGIASLLVTFAVGYYLWQMRRNKEAEVNRVNDSHKEIEH